MNRKHLLTGSFASLGILILILDGQTALSGAQTGLELCIKTVIPSLFPFFLLTILLSGSLSCFPLPFLRPLGKLCGIPDGAEGILLTGFLGGYPTGAQSVASLYRSDHLRKEDAERMLSFCNNAGPSFLFGMISSLFPDKTSALLLWAVHIASALLTGFLIPAPESRKVQIGHTQEVSFSEAMRSSVVVMSTVCGWVIVFRVILAFLDRWFLWTLPIALQVTITGILELTNGCCELAQVSDPLLRFFLCSGMLAWGGLCVTLQTHSVASGLKMRTYLKGKLLQTLFSLLLSAAIVLGIWLPVTAMLLILASIVQKTQKRSSNPAAVGV